MLYPKTLLQSSSKLLLTLKRLDGDPLRCFQAWDCLAICSILSIFLFSLFSTVKHPQENMTDNGSITHTIGNIARAATTRHRHSRHLSSTTALPVPPPPQHTNVATHRHDQQSNVHSHGLSADSSTTTNASTNLSQSPSNTSPADNRRMSQAGLTADDGFVNNITIEFDGGTHVIVRPNRVVRGNVP
jgi:hypothetical protein